MDIPQYPEHQLFFRLGTNSRTNFSWITTLTSTQSSAVKEDTVGLILAGNNLTTASKLILGTFIMSPTLELASMAPFKSNTSLLTLSCFQES